jgi:putative flippase GtrA
MQFLKYFLVGGFAALANLGFFNLFTNRLGWHYQISGAVAFIIATIINYILSILFVFQSGARFRRRHEISLVFLVSLIGLAVNQAVLFVAVSRFNLMPLLSQAISIGVVFFWNYLARKHFVFKSKGK